MKYRIKTSKFLSFGEREFHHTFISDHLPRKCYSCLKEFNYKTTPIFYVCEQETKFFCPECELETKKLLCNVRLTLKNRMHGHKPMDYFKEVKPDLSIQSHLLLI